jgi:hypothetical protein
MILFFDYARTWCEDLNESNRADLEALELDRLWDTFQNKIPEHSLAYLVLNRVHGIVPHEQAYLQQAGTSKDKALAFIRALETLLMPHTDHNPSLALHIIVPSADSTPTDDAVIAQLAISPGTLAEGMEAENWHAEETLAENLHAARMHDQQSSHSAPPPTVTSATSLPAWDAFPQPDTPEVTALRAEFRAAVDARQPAATVQAIRARLATALGLTMSDITHARRVARRVPDDTPPPRLTDSNWSVSEWRLELEEQSEALLAAIDANESPAYVARLQTELRATQDSYTQAFMTSYQAIPTPTTVPEHTRDCAWHQQLRDRELAPPVPLDTDTLMGFEDPGTDEQHFPGWDTLLNASLGGTGDVALEASGNALMDLIMMQVTIAAVDPPVPNTVPPPAPAPHTVPAPAPVPNTVPAPAPVPNTVPAPGTVPNTTSF